METKDYLTNYYERYDENGRLISKHGMVEYISCFNICHCKPPFLRSEKA